MARRARLVIRGRTARPLKGDAGCDEAGEKELAEGKDEPAIAATRFSGGSPVSDESPPVSTGAGMSRASNVSHNGSHAERNQNRPDRRGV